MFAGLGIRLIRNNELQLDVHEFERERDLPGYNRQVRTKHRQILQINMKFDNELIQHEWLTTLNSMLHDHHRKHEDKIVKYVSEASQDGEPQSPRAAREMHFHITRRIAYGSLQTRQVQFQKLYSLTEAQFFNQVDTGDILLFRSRDMIGSWLQRTFLDSHFDHVGILLRFGPSINDLYVFEAVGDGVRMVPWESARWYCGTYFDKIGYRKLHW